MKKHSRSLALLLGVLLLLSTAACSGTGDPEQTTEAENASTTAPETTETRIEETTSDIDIIITSPPETTASPDTEPPPVTETIRIIMQDGRGEAILSALAVEKYKTLLEAREKALLYDHGAEIELSKTDDLAGKIENLILSGEVKYDLILTDPMIGTEMMNSGLLEDVSGAGISIDALPGTLQSLTQSLSIGGRVYLFSPIALTSDLRSAYAMKYDGSPLSSDPVKAVLSGDFTVELMLTYIKESGFSLGSASPLALYRGIGGKIFTVNESGLPISVLTDTEGFSGIYGEALALNSAATEGTSAFTLEKLSSAGGGAIYLPIPKASGELQYSAPLDHEELSVFAAPLGVVSGTRLSALVSALNTCSDSYREGVRAEITAGGTEDARQMLDIIESNSRLDLGILLGWGDIDDLITDGLKNATAAEDILSDRLTEMRGKAVETAASIIADRLGIK